MRVLPYVGMPMRIVQLGGAEEAVVEAVHDGGRTIEIAGETFELHRLTGRYVRAGDPYYGRRAVPLSELP